MANYYLILAALDPYPSLLQINDALSYAEKIVTGYVKKIDPFALITVNEGDVEVYSNCEFTDLTSNAQYIYDAAFAEKIERAQGKFA